jgi:putative dehydrogenase
VKPNVAIFAQGTMGAGLAGVLTHHGVSVRTTLDGRSAASAARASAAGMHAVPFEELAGADVVLSILPPGEALPFARRFARTLAKSARRPLYVDCNAVSPRSVRAIEKTIVAAGCTFADIGIIGLPPGTASAPPRLYAAGSGTALLDSLQQYGLDVRRLDGPPGTASALKMAYGGITKGLIAVASAMILGASDEGVAEYLFRELSDSEPQLLASLSRRIVDMLPKAYRWVAEMKEISGFLAADPAAAAMYRNVAQFYARMAADAAGPGESAEALRRFFSQEPQNGR